MTYLLGNVIEKVEILLNLLIYFIKMKEMIIVRSVVIIYRNTNYGVFTYGTVSVEIDVGRVASSKIKPGRLRQVVMSSLGEIWLVRQVVMACEEVTWKVRQVDMSAFNVICY